MPVTSTCVTAAAARLQAAAGAVGLAPEDLRQRGKGARSKGRALLCTWLVDDLQIRASEVAHELGLTRGAVTTLIRRGRELVKEMKVSL